MEYLGNKELLKQHKTAFLASSTIPPDMVLKCYDWATAKHEGCVGLSVNFFLNCSFFMSGQVGAGSCSYR